MYVHTTFKEYRISKKDNMLIATSVTEDRHYNTVASHRFI